MRGTSADLRVDLRISVAPSGVVSSTRVRTPQVQGRGSLTAWSGRPAAGLPTATGSTTVTSPSSSPRPAAGDRREPLLEPRPRPAHLRAARVMLRPVHSLSTYAFYLGLTLAVELPLLAFALGRRCGRAPDARRGARRLGRHAPAALLRLAPRRRAGHVGAVGRLRRERRGARRGRRDGDPVLRALRPAPGARKRSTAGLVLDAFVVSLAVNAASFAVGALTW